MTQTPKHLSPIGTVEIINFPDEAIFGVPAKIDTGADYSSIWATDIRIVGDALEFNFFAPGSSYFQPEPVRALTFRRAHVKNSFGDSEDRFKVRLRVQIGDRKLLRWFNLADRSRNSYPVLLGKNFLKNTFIVDVSERHVAGDPAESRKVLVLGIGTSKVFFADVAKHMSNDVTIACASYRDLIYSFEGLDSAVMVNGDVRTDIASYSFVYFKTHNRAQEFAATAAEYLKFRSRPFLDKEVGEYTSMSKLSECMKLTAAGVPIPKTVSSSIQYMKTHFTELSIVLGLPFVVKEITSDKGRNNYLVHDEAQFLTIFASSEQGQQYLAQRFIPNDGFYRVYVTGRHANLAIWRAAHPNMDPLKAHLNKPSGGINATKVELDDVPAEVLALARQAAGAMNRQVAGVDLVQDSTTKEWYVLEVNNAPQIRTGSFLAEKTQMIADLLDKELNR